MTNRLISAVAASVAVAIAVACAYSARSPDTVAAQVTNGTVYAIDFGVKCDGSTDDTAAIQSAISAGIDAGTPPEGIRVVLPDGYCPISSTLTVASAWSFTLEGQGPRSTTLVWPSSAPSNLAALAVMDCRYCAFRDFGIETSSPTGGTIELDTGIRISNDGTTSAVLSTANRFEDLNLNGTNGAMRVGVAIIDGPGTYPTNASNNEHHVFERVRVSNFADYGFQIGGAHTLVSGGPGGGNYKGIRFRDSQCSCASFGNACVYQWSGWYDWHGGSAGGCTDATFYAEGTAGPVTIANVDGEGSTRFLYVTGPSGSSKNFTIIGARAVAGSGYAADGCWMFLGGRGPYTIIGGEIGSMDYPLGLCHSPGGNSPLPASVTIIGTRWLTTLTSITGASWCSSHTCLAPNQINVLRSTNTVAQPTAWP